MSSFSLFASASLYTGLAYLLGKVLHSLLVYDIPATASEDNKPARQRAFDHYSSRKTTDQSYKVVPIACVLLTSGVFATAVSQGGSPASVCTLLVALLTAFNNGKNVVDPVNALVSDAKRDKEDLLKALKGIARGHWMDVIGFAAIFLLHTFF